MTLTLGLPEQMFQMAHLHVKENYCVKLFSSPSTTVEVIVGTNSDGQRHAHTNTSTQTGLSLTQLSHSLQADSTKTISRLQFKCGADDGLPFPMVENIVGKGGNAGYKRFLQFSAFNWQTVLGC